MVMQSLVDVYLYSSRGNSSFTTLNVDSGCTYYSRDCGRFAKGVTDIDSGFR